MTAEAEEEQKTTGAAEEVTIPRRGAERRKRKKRIRRRKAPSSDSKSARFSLAAFALLIVLSPHLLAGVLLPTTFVIAGLSVFAGVASVWHRKSKLPRKHPVDALFLGLLGWTGVQLLPLPPGFWELISPERLEVQASLSLLGEEGAWQPLSLDPAGTYHALVIGGAAFFAYVSGRLNTLRKEGARLLPIFAISGTAIALSALAHKLVGASSVYGVYEPLFAGPPILSPILNANALAGFCAFGAHCALVLTLSSKYESQQLASFLAVCACSLVVLLCVSRGGTLALLLGFLAIGGARAFRKRGKRMSVGTAGGLLTLVAVLSVGLYFTFDAVDADLDRFSLSKFALAGEGLAVAMSFPLLGVGRGAFDSVHAGIAASPTRFTHPENILIQWGAEWGLAATAIILLLLLTTFLLAIRSPRTERFGLAFALLAWGVHDLVDFSLEMPGLLVVAAGALGVLIGDGPRATKRSGKKRSPYGARLFAGGVAAGAVLLLLGCIRAQPEVNHAVDSLADCESIEAASEVVRLRPMHPAIALAAGTCAAKQGDPSALRWMNRAMQLAPKWPGPHSMAADLLWARSPTQAIVEVREALARNVQSVAPQACAYLAARPEISTLERLVPPNEAGDLTLRQLSLCIREPEELVIAIDDAILARDPANVEALTRQAGRASSESPEEALRTLRRLREEAPEQSRAWVESAAIVRRLEDAEAALQELEGAPSDRDSLRARARYLAELQRAEEMREILTALRGRAGGRAHDLAAAWVFAGTLEEQVDAQMPALEAFQRASRIDSRSIAAHAGIIRVGQRVGRSADVTRARRALCDLGQQGHCAER